MNYILVYYKNILTITTYSQKFLIELVVSMYKSHI